MSISVTTAIPAIHPAFNPTPLVITKTASETQVSITLDGIERVREFLGTTATFDVSSVVKHLLVEGLTEINAAGNSGANTAKAYTDALMSKKYALSIEEGANSYYIALNAALQAGQAIDYFVSRTNKLLTGFERLRFFAGYPQRVYVLPGSTNNFLNFLSAGTAVVSKATPGGLVWFAEMAFNTSPSYVRLSTTTYSPGNDVDNRPVDTPCLPASPFWVRWVNQIGGMDHWMFGGRQFEGLTLKEKQTYTPATNTIGKYKRQISAEAENMITVGASGLSENEYQNISRIILSPKIEYYDSGEWIPITIDKAELSRNTGEPMQEIELSFELPQPNLQH